MKISSLPFSAGAVSVFTLLLFSSAALIGCGVGELAGPAPVTPAPLSGRAMGGEQPIANGTVTLYSTTNNGVAQSAGFYAGTATSLGSVTTKSDGTFTFTSGPTCSDPNQVYITASGGNAGGNTNNANILMVAAIGNCDLLTPSTYIVINEVTTAAAAYALAGFTSISGTTVNISSSATNYAGQLTSGKYVGNTSVAAGLTHAFENAANLASYATGTAYASSPANSGAVIPQQLLNSVGNSLQGCVNSDGSNPGSIPETTCDMLFSYAVDSGGNVPTNTLQAALNIARNPTLNGNVTNLYNLATAQSAFGPSLAGAPNDWSLAIFYPAGTNGLIFPYPIALDANDNVYIVNPATNVSTTATTATTFIPYSSNGTLLYSPVTLAASSSSGYGAIKGLAVDSLGNVWIENVVATAGSNLLKLTASTGNFTAQASPAHGYSLAVDKSNNVWVGTTATASSITEYVQANSYAAATLPSGTVASPAAAYSINVDAKQNIWTADFSASSGGVSVLPNSTPSGSPSYTTTIVNQTGIQGDSAYGISFNSSGAFLSAGTGTAGINPLTTSVNSSSVITSVTVGTEVTGSATTSSTVNTQLSSPRYLTTDGIGTLWIPDNSPTLTAPVTLPIVRYNPSTGTLLGLYPCYPTTSNTCSTSSTTGSPVGASRYIVVDSSGALWVASPGSGEVVQVLGAAAPAWPLLSMGKPGVMP